MFNKWFAGSCPSDGVFRQKYGGYWQVVVGGKWVNLTVGLASTGWHYNCSAERPKAAYCTTTGEVVVTQGNDEYEAIIRWYERITGKRHRNRSQFLTEMKDLYQCLRYAASRYEERLTAAAEAAREFEEIRFKDKQFNVCWSFAVTASNYRQAARKAFDTLQGLEDVQNRNFLVTEARTLVDQSVDLTAGPSMQLFSIQQFKRFSAYLTWAEAVDFGGATPQEKELIVLLGYHGQMVHPYHFECLPARQSWSARPVYVDRVMRNSTTFTSHYFPSKEELVGFCRQDIKQQESEHTFFDNNDQLHLLEGAAWEDLKWQL